MGEGLPKLNRCNRKLWVYSFGMGLFTNVLPFSLLAWAQTQVSSSFAGISMSLVPLITLILAHFFLADDQLSKIKLIGLSVGFLGVFLLFEGHKITSDFGSVNNLKFKLACICAAICYGIGSIITRMSPDVSKISFGSSGLLIATIIIIPTTLTTHQFPVKVEPISFIALLYLGFFSTGLATLILVYIIKIAGPTFLSLVNYLVPIWAIIFGIFLNAESVKPIYLMALILILIGMFINRVGTNRN